MSQKKKKIPSSNDRAELLEAFLEGFPIQDLTYPGEGDRFILRTTASSLSFTTDSAFLEDYELRSDKYDLEIIIPYGSNQAQLSPLDVSSSELFKTGQWRVWNDPSLI